MARELERRVYVTTCELRADDGKPAHVHGIAAPYYDGTEGTQYRLWDNAVERYAPGCFDGDMDDVAALFNHDSSLLLGRTTSGTLKLEERDDGLHYDIRLGGTTVARDVVEHLERGDIRGSSCGWIPTREEWTRDGNLDVRTIHKARLMDVSVVTFPAYAGTPVEVRSARESFMHVREQRMAEQAEEMAMAAARLRAMLT